MAPIALKLKILIGKALQQQQNGQQVRPMDMFFHLLHKSYYSGSLNT